jgi:GntR family transcriptional regulator
MRPQLKLNRTPLHLQVQEYLLDLMADGTYQPGEQLPSEVDLAAELGVSRPTLREALLHLEQEGLVVRRHGVGTFVAPEQESFLESGLERLESVLGLAARQGIRTQMRGLSVEQKPATEELAERLNVAPGIPLTCVRRTIVVKRRPAAYLVDYSPASLLPADRLDVSFSGSVLDLLATNGQGIQVHEALAQITATNADALLAEQLEVAPGQALLLMTETLFTDDNVPIGFSYNYFLPDLFRFHVVRR